MAKSAGKRSRRSVRRPTARKYSKRQKKSASTKKKQQQQKKKKKKKRTTRRGVCGGSSRRPRRRRAAAAAAGGGGGGGPLRYGLIYMTGCTACDLFKPIWESWNKSSSLIPGVPMVSYEKGELSTPETQAAFAALSASVPAVSLFPSIYRVTKSGRAEIFPGPDYAKKDDVLAWLTSPDALAALDGGDEAGSAAAPPTSPPSSDALAALAAAPPTSLGPPQRLLLDEPRALEQPTSLGPPQRLLLDEPRALEQPARRLRRAPAPTALSQKPSRRRIPASTPATVKRA